MYAMHGPADTELDKDFWSTGEYKEIVPLQKIVATDSFADGNGNVVPGSYYGMSEESPRELQLTVTFEAIDGKTKLTIRHSGMSAGPESDGTSVGWNESLDKLSASLAA